MSAESYKGIDPARWNACLKLLCRPLDSLDAVQRSAALVLDYDGRVQNGGHSSYWDSPNRDDEGLLRALRDLGAHEQATILMDARVLKSEADEAIDRERDSIWELIEDLDRRYYRLNPDIPELLARHFDAHPENFPTVS